MTILGMPLAKPSEGEGNVPRAIVQEPNQQKSLSTLRNNQEQKCIIEKRDNQVQMCEWMNEKWGVTHSLYIQVQPRGLKQGLPQISYNNNPLQ